MLDQIDLEQTISKHDYQKRLSTLQTRLYDLGQALIPSRVPVIVLFEGWAGTSKIGAIQTLTRRLDPRGVRVHPITSARTYEQQYPWLYRFWLKTPGYGQMAIFDRSWYREVLAEHMQDASAQLWRARCDDIASFERQLADDGTLILKFWLHITRKEQARRFDELAADKLTAWQVTDEDRWQNKHYKEVQAAVEDLLVRTDTSHAPWIVVPATDPRAMQISLFESIQRALEARLGNVPSRYDVEHDALPAASPAPTEAPSAEDMSSAPAVAAAQEARRVPAVVPQPAPGILHRADLSHTIDEKTYDHKLTKLQAKLHMLGYEIYRQKCPVVLVFEGWDAAGKGGTIQRITGHIDPRSYTVHSIAAPAGDDKEHHYLYRFWRRLPSRGAMAIFDRSWYGRVLVERVEGFARPDEWQRAYAEINEFERQLAEYGTVVCKFWMHISPEEQLRRFEERQKVAYKTWKITDEDWRNREKWSQYEQAADEMLLRTSSTAAPWTVVEAEDKRYGRIKVLRTVVKRLEDALGKVKL